MECKKIFTDGIKAFWNGKLAPEKDWAKIESSACKFEKLSDLK